MAFIKSNYAKFVVILFCLSQVQGGSRLISEKSDGPYEELFKEISKSVDRIWEKVQLRMNEADVHVDKYIDNLKDKIEGSNVQFHETLQKIEEIVEKYNKQICEFIPQQIDRIVEELKSKDPEIAEKVKRLKVELSELKADLLKLYEEMKKPILERFNEVKEEVISKSKPIVKRWTPIVKDIEEIILALIPDKKKEIKKY
jgi:uncharacterized coiled-coil DUF342 family protein